MARGSRILTAGLLLASSGAIGGPATAQVACVAVPVADDRCESWVAVYDNPEGYSLGGKDIQWDVESSRDGKLVFVTGRSEQAAGGGYDAMTLAYDATTGAEVWKDRYNGPGGQGDSGQSLALSPDGATLYLAGWHSGAGNTDYLAIAYEAATGRRLWVRGVDPSNGGSDSGLNVAADADRVYLTGVSFAENGGDFLTVALDAVTGGVLWDARYNGPQSANDSPVGIDVDAAGTRVAVAGQSPGFAMDYATIVYDATTGKPVWQDRYDGGVNDTPMAMDMSADGSTVVVTGETFVEAGTPPRVDIATIAYDAATGARRWLAKHSGTSGAGSQGTGVVVSNDGRRAFVAGKVAGTNVYDDTFGTVAYDVASGQRLWAMEYGRPSVIFGGYDWPQAVAVNPQGTRVYTTGFSGDGVHHNDFATIAYDAATGAQAWVARHTTDGIARQFPRRIAVAPDGGRLFVSGYARRIIPGLSCDDCNEYDYVTLAYPG